MAGNVQSNVHINVTSNVQDTINNIISQYNIVKASIEDCMNNPMNYTTELVNKINTGIIQMSHDLASLDGVIPVDQFMNAFELIDGIKKELHGLGSNIEKNNQIQSLIDGINEYKTTIRDMESGKIAFDASKYEEAKIGLKNLTEEFENYKKSIGEIEEIPEGIEEIPDVIEEIDTEEAVENIQNLGINTEDLKNQLLGFIATGKLSSNSLMALAKNFKIPTIAITALIEAIKLGKKQVDEFLADMEKAGDIISNAFDYGVDLSVDSINNLIGTIENLIQKSYELAESGVAIQNGYFTLFNYLGDEAGTEVVQFTEDLQRLYGLNPDKLVGGMRGILGMVSNMSLEAEKATKVVEAFTMFGQDLSAFSGYDVNEVVGQLESAVNLGSIRITSPIIRALDLTKEDVQAFRELNSVQERANFLLEKGEKVRGTYEKWLQTAGGKVEIFRTSLENLNSNLSKLFAGLYAKVAPILTDLVNMLSWCVESIAKVFNIDLKEAEANVAGDYYEKVASGIDSVAESADKAKRKVASFDDVIQINDDGSAGGLGESFGFDPSMLGNWTDLPTPELTEFQKQIEKIKELLADGKFYQAGRELANMLNYWLTGIPWDDIKSNLEWLGLDIANFLNGIFENTELFGTIGNTLAEGINSVFSLLLGFGRNFDFKQFGVSAGTLWKSFWDGLDANDIGETFYEYIMGGFESLAGFLEAGSLSDMTGKIGDSIVSFFNNFDDADITLMAGSVIDLLDDIFGSIGDLHNKLKESDIKDKLKLFITELMTGFSENSGEWGTILGDALSGALSFAGDMLETADKAGLSEGIRKFLSGLDLGQIFAEWFWLKVELFLLEIESLLPAKLELLGASLASILAVIVSSMLTVVIAPIYKLTNKAFSIGYDLGKRLGDGIANAFKSIWETIKSWWNNNVAKDIRFSTPSWLGGKQVSFSIPKLATGGVINRATLAMVGEDGAEAVVPLERNLGWIDKLSTSLANKINSGSGNGGNITISLEEISKPFYTRSEMLDFAEHVVNCLKIYGVNVAIVN